MSCVEGGRCRRGSVIVGKVANIVCPERWLPKIGGAGEVAINQVGSFFGVL